MYLYIYQNLHIRKLLGLKFTARPWKGQTDCTIYNEAHVFSYFSKSY